MFANIPRTFRYLGVGMWECSDIPLLPTFGRSLNSGQQTLSTSGQKLDTFFISYFGVERSASNSEVTIAGNPFYTKITFEKSVQLLSKCGQSLLLSWGVHLGIMTSGTFLGQFIIGRLGTDFRSWLKHVPKSKKKIQKYYM